MKKAFTLIELIFVIVIIGLLAAVAVPKFLNLKQNAQAGGVVKTTIDSAQQAAETALNYVDLEDNSSFTLENILKLQGKGWKYDPNTNNGKYYYQDPANDSNVSYILLDINNRRIEYSIDCTKFSDTTTQNKCKKLLGDRDGDGNDDNSIDINLTY